MIFRQERFLHEHAGEWRLPAGARWNPILYNNYQPQNTTLNLLWFAGRDRTPRVVTKIYRDAACPSREFERLTSAYSAAPSWVPRPLHFGHDGPFWALWMEGVPGLPVAVPRGLSSDAFSQMVSAVSSMHRDLGAAATPRSVADRRRRMVTDPLNTLSAFGTSSAVQSGCAALAAAISGDRLASLPAIPQHGDLYFSHMLVKDQRWYVIDWETFGQVDLPAYDVFTLLLSILRTGGDTPAEWDSRLTRPIPGLLSNYAATFGLKKDDLSWLLPLSLTNWFHLQWADGRKEFTTSMYQVLEKYFANQESWQKAFLGVGRSC